MQASNRPRAAVVVAALTLSGCAAVGPDFHPPAAPAAPGYAMKGDAASPRVELSPEARPAGEWWTALGSPELDQVIRQALKDSPTLAEADAVLARARAQTDAARGGGRLQADLTASAKRERINTTTLGFSSVNIPGFPDFSSPTLNLYSVGGAVSYDLDLFGGRRRRVEEAEARTQAQARRADAAYLTLTGNVALAAVRVASLRAERAALQATIDDDRRILDMVVAAIDAGGENSGSLATSQAELAKDEALAPPLERDLGEARHRLAMLAGQAPGAWSPPEFELTSFTLPGAIPVSLPSALVRQRPDILAAEADLHAATAEIGVRTADLYPNVSLTANLTQAAQSPDNLFGYSASGWAIGPALTAPLLHGGTLRANRRAAEADARAAMARYQQAVLTAFVQVADSLEDLAQSDATVAALTRSEAANERNLRKFERGYRLGGTPLMRVVDAQRELARARRDRVRAEGDRLSAVVNLFAAVAADWRGAPAAGSGPVAAR
jgi:NodT family efflux transporter outer membrane factor (OMF) lipoprotein